MDSLNLKKSFSFKPKVNDDRNDNHHHQNNRITILPFEFGHIDEVHSVKPYNKGKREKKCRENSE